MHDAKKEGGGVLGIWKSLFPDAARALESGPFARKQSQSFGGGSSTQAHQQPICVPMQTNYWHYQYPWYGYGPWYGNVVGTQVDLAKEDSSSSSSDDDSTDYKFGEYDLKANEKQSDTITTADVKKTATPKSLALTSRKRRWHEEEEDDNLSASNYPKTIIPPPQPKKSAVSDVWLIAGDEALDQKFHDNVIDSCREHSWLYLEVRLPVENVVLHAANAISYLVHSIDNGLLRTSATKKLGVVFADDPNLHCAVSEASLASWPTNRWRDPHVGRIDNINACMRAFTVDGRSTKSIGGPPAKLFRNEFKSCLVLGSRGTFARIHIPTYRDRRCQYKRAALTDNSLVEEFSYANYFKGESAPNGIELNTVTNVVTSMVQSIKNISGVGPSNLVVLLTPHGDLL